MDLDTLYVRLSDLGASPMSLSSMMGTLAMLRKKGWQISAEYTIAEADNNALVTVTLLKWGQKSYRQEYNIRLLPTD